MKLFLVGTGYGQKSAIAGLESHGFKVAHQTSATEMMHRSDLNVNVSTQSYEAMQWTRRMLLCDAVALLDGWGLLPGNELLVQIAVRAGLPVMSVKQWNNIAGWAHPPAIRAALSPQFKTNEISHPI